MEKRGVTTYQLREICRREKIMNGVIHPLDKEELIQTIMRYMGQRQDFFICDKKKGGEERVEEFLKKTRIVISISESIYLDENVIAAKELIDEYLEDEIKDASFDIKQLVTSAFRVKQGVLDVRSILKLRSLRIDDERWKKAMDIIADSIVVKSSKSCLRLYKQNAEGTMEYVPLDFAVIA